MTNNRINLKEAKLKAEMTKDYAFLKLLSEKEKRK